MKERDLRMKIFVAVWARRYPFSDAEVEQFLNDFTKPKPPLRRWVFELCDPAPRADPFMTNDDLAAYTREVGTRGQDYRARWADLTIRERRRARRIKRFAKDKRRVLMGAGRPQNVDRALVLYVIRRIEEATGVPFRFSHPAPLTFLGGPLLRLAEAALLRLFHIDDRTAGYLGLVSPARRYKREGTSLGKARISSDCHFASGDSGDVLLARGANLVVRAISESSSLAKPDKKTRIKAAPRRVRRALPERCSRRHLPPDGRPG
jgi:hypothetical protein